MEGTEINFIPKKPRRSSLFVI